MYLPPDVRETLAEALSDLLSASTALEDAGVILLFQDLKADREKLVKSIMGSNQRVIDAVAKLVASLSGPEVDSQRISQEFMMMCPSGNWSTKALREFVGDVVCKATILDDIARSSDQSE